MFKALHSMLLPLLDGMASLIAFCCTPGLSNGRAVGCPCRSLKEAEDAGAYLDLLMPSYKALPEDCIQKARWVLPSGYTKGDYYRVVLRLA